MSKLKEKNTLKLLKLGKTSLAVAIPKEMVADLDWQSKQKACPVVSPTLLLGWWSRR